MRIQHLWVELLSLNTIISKPAEELTPAMIEEYETRARQWGLNFTDVYQRDNITPYTHTFMNHVSEFMKIHGSILPFTQQGLEKKNDIMMKTFFRSSNHRGEAALQQIIEKQNRLEHLRDMGIKRTKVFEECSNCNIGHNRLTCLASCRNCGVTPYCKHLVIIESGRKVPSCEKEN